MSAKCGAPSSSPLQIVRPAMDRAHDVARVAAAVEHQRLPVPADVGQQLDAARVADEHLRVAARGEHLEVADVRHHELVPDVAGRAREQQPLLGFEHAGIAIPGDRELRRGLTQMTGRGEVRHRPTLSSQIRLLATNPTQQPGTLTALQLRASLKAAPDRFAKSAARKGIRSWPRRQKMLVYAALRHQVKTLARFSSLASATALMAKPADTSRRLSKPRSPSSRRSSRRWKAASCRCRNRSPRTSAAPSCSRSARRR